MSMSSLKQVGYVFVGILSVFAVANAAYADSCERKIQVQLKRNSFSLDLDDHIQNSADAARFDLPVSCDFYDAINAKDELLKKKFQWGSFMAKGTSNAWSMRVLKKYPDQKGSPSDRCQGLVKIEIKQIKYGGSLTDLAENYNNRVNVVLPVGCDTYSDLQVGEDFFKGLRLGSAFRGSLNSWRVEVKEKLGSP